jgi:hypothetical protein
MKPRDTQPFVPVIDAAAIADLEDRRRLLRAASRPHEPLTSGRGPTAQGHILSAIAQIERELARLRMG